MKLATLARARLERGLSLRTLGPVEARFAFDALFAALGAAAAAGLAVGFMGAPWGLASRVALLPPAFIGASFLVGLYGRFRLATVAVKAAALAAAGVAAALVGLAGGAPPVLVVVWAIVTLPPVISARLLLSLPYSRHREFASLAVNRHGPVVVVGGAGYIGSHTVRLLLERGNRVRVLDRLMYGRTSLEPFLAHPHFELVEGDVTDIGKLAQAFRHASAVIHLAGVVGDPACSIDDRFTRHTNIIATRMAKEVAQGLGIYRFIFASSCSVYGVTDTEAKESDALNPVSLYAQTKIDSEQELLFSCPDDFFVTILRFATVFGHSFRPRFDLVANLFTAQAMTNGEITVIGPNQWRPFVHVRDLARAIVLVLEANPARMQSQIFNVGDARLNMTIGQLGELVQRVASAHRPVSLSVSERPEDRRNYAVSFDKIRRELGFEAETLMEAGIEEMVGHFLRGGYGDFRNPVYSNLATTREVLREFYDPAELGRLYGPLTVR